MVKLYNFTRLQKSTNGFQRAYFTKNGETGNNTRNKYRFCEPFSLISGRTPKIVTAHEAVQLIRSNSKVFIQGAAATSNHIVDAMARHGLQEKLENVKLYHIHTHGEMPVGEKYKGIFLDHSLFMGHNVRNAVNEGFAEFIPVFLSEIPRLFMDDVINLDVAIIQVSPPDKHGYCSLGTSVDCTRAAIKNAAVVIAQVNKYMPRTHGDGHLHSSHIDMMVEKDEKLFGWDDLPATPNKIQEKIGERVAELIEDGCTIQLGIGAIPNAVCAKLGGHRDLGVHSEMFMDGVVDLIQKGVITNSHKNIHRGKTVGSFVVGSKKLYQFLDDNPSVGMFSCGYVNNIQTIRRIDNMVAINSAIEIDLTGQVVAESLGPKMLSGVGGQIDFMRGAAASNGGKPIMALPSVSSKGHSRIVSSLLPGAMVTTTRAFVHYVVTEHGAVNLRGKSMKERARLLISIAHPDHRERLTQEASARFKGI